MFTAEDFLADPRRPPELPHEDVRVFAATGEFGPSRGSAPARNAYLIANQRWCSTPREGARDRLGRMQRYNVHLRAGCCEPWRDAPVQVGGMFLRRRFSEKLTGGRDVPTHPQPAFPRQAHVRTLGRLMEVLIATLLPIGHTITVLRLQTLEPRLDVSPLPPFPPEAVIYVRALPIPPSAKRPNLIHELCVPFLTSVLQILALRPPSFSEASPALRRILA